MLVSSILPYVKIGKQGTFELCRDQLSCQKSFQAFQLIYIINSDVLKQIKSKTLTNSLGRLLLSNTTNDFKASSTILQSTGSQFRSFSPFIFDISLFMKIYVSLKYKKYPKRESINIWQEFIDAVSSLADYEITNTSQRPMKITDRNGNESLQLLKLPPHRHRKRSKSHSVDSHHQINHQNEGSNQKFYI